MQSLRLDTFATAWQGQQQDPATAALGFDERRALLVHAEHLARENTRVQRALKDAKLRLSQACVEDRGALETAHRAMQNCAQVFRCGFRRS